MITICVYDAYKNPETLNAHKRSSHDRIHSKNALLFSYISVPVLASLCTLSFQSCATRFSGPSTLWALFMNDKFDCANNQKPVCWHWLLETLSNASCKCLYQIISVLIQHYHLRNMVSSSTNLVLPIYSHRREKETVATLIDESGDVTLLCFNLANFFDSVNHTILLSKLQV